MSNPWLLRYDGYEPDEEGVREVLCALGNGYMATRAAAPECDADEVHYPGTYLAGTFNRLDTMIGEVTVTNESMVNQPNWLPVRFHTPGHDWFHPDVDEIEQYRLELDLRRGLLTRRLTWVDGDDRRTSLTQRRFVHMQHHHLAGLETTFVAENWNGDLTVRSAVDGSVDNTGVARYRDLASHHHDVIRQEHVDDETVLLQVETNQSHVRVAQSARTRVYREGEPITVDRRRHDADGVVGQDLVVPLEQGRPATVVKVAAVHSSGDLATSECAEQAVRTIGRAPGFDDLVASHVHQWAELWDRFHLELREPDDRAHRILNLHTFHTLQTVSPNSMDLDVGVPARGLHGEAYRGHILWDEMFVIPFLTLRLPALSRSLLLYRYHRLDEARAAARAAGFEGAMFPWQSGSDGREESQQLHLNPLSGRWLPDHSDLQRHINHAIAFNAIHYVQTTDDTDFMRYRAGPLLIDIARFLASLTTYDRMKDRYRILRVMGPDEFHEAYPDAEQPGIDDNAYTNVMTVWVLLRVRELLEGLPEDRQHDLRDHTQLNRAELDAWDAISRRMYVPFHGDGIISQFEGYEDLEELDWDDYRERYEDIHRMDRILEAEGDSADRYKVSKQADVLMLFYLLTADELQEIFDRLGYAWDTDAVPRTIDYYLQRTSHGSTLSGVVHSWLLARRDREESWGFFQQALDSDIADVQGGTTPEGVHLGAMAGTLDLVQRGYTGVAALHGVLWFKPALPRQVSRLAFPLYYRGHRLHVAIEDDELSVSAPPSSISPVLIGHRGRSHELASGNTIRFPIGDRPDEEAAGAPPADDPDIDPDAETSEAAHEGEAPPEDLEEPPTARPGQESARRMK